MPAMKEAPPASAIFKGASTPAAAIEAVEF
jgi:hypothetical protein